MKNFLAIAFIVSGLSANADLKVFATVRGTNVVDVTQFDTLKPPTFAQGVTNIAITLSEASVIGHGWSYSNGEFRDKNGAGLPAEVVAKKAREEKAKAFVAKYNDRKADWGTLKVAEQGDVLGRLCALIEAILELHPELLEPKEASQ